jgi:hypothetical protein
MRNLKKYLNCYTSKRSKDETSLFEGQRVMKIQTCEYSQNIYYTGPDLTLKIEYGLTRHKFEFSIEGIFSYQSSRTGVTYIFSNGLFSISHLFNSYIDQSKLPNYLPIDIRITNDNMILFSYIETYAKHNRCLKHVKRKIRWGDTCNAITYFTDYIDKTFADMLKITILLMLLVPKKYEEFEKELAKILRSI